MEHKAAIRAKALTTATLGSMEAHGKRQDQRSQARRTQDVEPLVYGTLNLVEAFKKHTEGVRWNKAAKNTAIHAILQFPIGIKPTEENQQKMMHMAKEFINSRHGGNAVFAMRLDRDEAGVNKVDVFYTPTYVKTTKKHGEERWASLTKFPRDLCEEHRAEIERRHGGKFATGPRQCGIALNSEFRTFLEGKGLTMAAKTEKPSKYSDWLTPEEYKFIKILHENERLYKIVRGLDKAVEKFSDLIPKNIKTAINVLTKHGQRPVRQKQFLEQQKQGDPLPLPQQDPDISQEEEGQKFKL